MQGAVDQYTLNLILNYLILTQGMKCVITYTTSTENEDFYGIGADAKVPDLGSKGVNLEMIFGPMKQDLNAGILVDVRDAP